MTIKAHINGAPSRLMKASLVLVSLPMLKESIMVIFLSVFACRWQGDTAVHIAWADNGHL